MQTKLTLRMDRQLIRNAKVFAKKTGKSVSQIVSDYFTILAKGEQESGSELTPVVRSLKGVLRGADVGVEDYRRYLEEKGN